MNTGDKALLVTKDFLNKKNVSFTETEEYKEYVFGNGTSNPSSYLKLHIAFSDPDVECVSSPGPDELSNCATDDEILEGFRLISDGEIKALAGGFGDDSTQIIVRRMIGGNSYLEIKCQRADLQQILLNSDLLSTLKN